MISQWGNHQCGCDVFFHKKKIHHAPAFVEWTWCMLGWRFLKKHVGCRDGHMVRMDMSALLLRGAKWAMKKLIYIGDCNGVWGYNCIPTVGLSNCCPLTWAFCSFQASIIARWVFLVVSRLPWSRKKLKHFDRRCFHHRLMHLFLEGSFFNRSLKEGAV